ncbi:hypothetical protein [Streptomyces sp. YIM 130001]|nr:hypothetical protein [Streptomyces sp. YIM 130001]
MGEERLAALGAECARPVPLGAVQVRTPDCGHDSCIPVQDTEGSRFRID